MQVGPVEMTGPKYPGVVESHSYGPVGVKVRGELAVTGPVYPADPANKFSIVPERRSGQPILAGPAYHGVEAKNMYNPQVCRVSVQRNPKLHQSLDGNPGSLADGPRVWRARDDGAGAGGQRRKQVPHHPGPCR